MGATAGILMFAGAATSAMSQKAAGDINRDIGEFNAGVAEFQAKDAIRRGRTAENQLRTQTKGLIGSQRVNLAAQGVDVNDIGGSAVDIQEDTAALSEMDALMIRNNARREAFGYKVQAANASMQGQFAQSQGNQAAANTLITGAGQAYAAYHQFS